MSNTSDPFETSVPPEEPEPRRIKHEFSWEEQYKRKEKEPIGRGGLGQVFHVVDLNSNVEFALKQLTLDSDESLGRFRREVAIQQAFQHPQITPVIDAGDDWFVMPLADGSLREEARCLTPIEICDAFEDIALGISEAHFIGVIHRDVKPANMLAFTEARRRTWKLSDFGLASRVLDETRLTTTGAFLGTRDFASPEALVGVKDLTPATDIYSFGRSLQWALTSSFDSLPPPPWADLISATTERRISDRPHIDEVLAALGSIRISLRAKQLQTWGKPVQDLSDKESMVLTALVSVLTLRDGESEHTASFHSLDEYCRTTPSVLLRIQIKSLERKGMISQDKQFADAWRVNDVAWDWLEQNQDDLDFLNHHKRRRDPES